MSIDERRTLFRLNRWHQPQDFIANPFDIPCRQSRPAHQAVWFAGVHSDVGGGYPEIESGLSKFPLAWLIDEAVAKGLKIDLASERPFGVRQTLFQIEAILRAAVRILAIAPVTHFGLEADRMDSKAHEV